MGNHMGREYFCLNRFWQSLLKKYVSPKDCTGGPVSDKEAPIYECEAGMDGGNFRVLRWLFVCTIMAEHRKTLLL